MTNHNPKSWCFGRYTGAPYPAYRFVPGVHPHPTSDPAGHSYTPPGTQEPSVTYVPPDRWPESPDYLYGIDLYNHGYWWEAHEAWEGLWQLTDKRGPQGKFLQGLIQTAAVHLKHHQNHPRGFARLRKSSQAYLHEVVEHCSSMYMGLDIPAFVSSVDIYYGAIRLGEPHDVERFPYLKLANLAFCSES